MHKVQFGLVPNWTFIALGGSWTVIIEEANILILQILNALCFGQSKV